jgi:4-hydroxy-4-methyl-2-oxoglutarate aldolase
MPIVCDGALVHPGDLVVADGDGVLVIPGSQAAAVLAAARQRSRREDEVAQAIRDGAHLWDLIGAEAAYRALDPEEIDAAWKP